MDRTGDIARRLHHPEEEIRRQAIAELDRLSGSESLALLSEALGDSSWRVRKTAADVIVRHPEQKAAIATLVNALYDSENVGRRTSAIEALVMIGEPAMDDLVSSYQTYDVDVRKFVIDIVGDIGSKKATPFLLRSLSDQDENVRLASVEALGKVGGAESYDKLIELVNQPQDMPIRFSALHILGKLGRPLPSPLIERLLQERMFRRAVFEVLGESPSQFGVDHLIKGIEDSAKSARQAAIRSLAAIYEKDSAGVFRPRIAQGMQSVLKNQALNHLAEFLEGNHYHTKRAVIRLLGLVESADTLRYLFHASLDDSIADEVAAILEKLSEERSDWFKRELNKEPDEIRSAVKRLLQEEEVIWPLTVESKLELSDEEFELIRGRITASYGMNFDPEMKYIMERRVKQRMIALKLSKVFDYIRRLEDIESGGDELYQLANLLVTNETYFFREEFQLRTFGEEIMPELIASAMREGRNTIRVWSAGCSSGEEPYTIAMLIAERKDLGNLKVEIYGSDLSEQMIAKARRGVYGASSFRVMDKSYVDNYFIMVGSQYQLCDQIKNMVKLDILNLLSFNYQPYLKNLDVIFCRNVLIYFGLEARRGVVDRFFQILRPGGFLLLGHSESLMNLSTAFQLRHFKHDLVYQKPALGEKDWKRS